MLGGARVPGGVLVLRFVAAADVATGEAEAQVDPVVAEGQALEAAISARRDGFERLDVGAVLHGVTPVAPVGQAAPRSSPRPPPKRRASRYRNARRPPRRRRAGSSP